MDPSYLLDLNTIQLYRSSNYIGPVRWTDTDRYNWSVQLVNPTSLPNWSVQSSQSNWSVILDSKIGQSNWPVETGESNWSFKNTTSFDIENMHTAYIRDSWCKKRNSIFCEQFRLYAVECNRMQSNAIEFHRMQLNAIECHWLPFHNVERQTYP